MRMRASTGAHTHGPVERLSTVQARGPRLPAFRHVAVRVATVAPPSQGPTDASSVRDLNISSLRHAVTSGSGDVSPADSHAHAHNPTSDADRAALLERTSSGGLATTSEFTPSPKSAPSGRKRGNGDAPGAPGGRRFSHGRDSNGTGNNSGGRGRGRANSTNRDAGRRSTSDDGSSASGSHGDGEAGGGFQPRAFTAQLSAASSLSELQALFEQGRQHDINSIHIATLWTRLAKLASPPPPRTEAGGRPADLRMQPPTSSPSSASSSSAPTSTSASTSTSAPQEEQQQQGQQGQGRGQGRRQRQAEAPSPAALAAFVSALEDATTREQLGGMQARGLANVVWAAAKLKPAAEAPGPGPGQEAAGDAAGAAQQEESGAGAGEEEQQQQGQGQSSRPRPARIRGGKTALAKAAAAEAAAAAAAAAAASANRLPTTLVSRRLLRDWVAAAEGKVAEFNMQDLSNAVWALGSLGFQPPGSVMRKLSIALMRELRAADRPQQVSNVLLGLAGLRFVPPAKDFWEPLWRAIERQVLAEQSVPDVQAVSNSLWSLAQLAEHCPDMPPVPRELVSKAVFRAVQWGDRLSGSQVQDVLTSLPRLGFQPSELQADKLLSLSRRVLPACDATALSNLVYALGAVGVRPGGRWLGELLAAFHAQLPAASPEAVCRLLFCMAGLRRTPPDWMPEVWAKLGREVGHMKAADIAFALLAIKRLWPHAAAAPAQSAQDGDEPEAAEVGASAAAAASSADADAHSQGAVAAAPQAEEKGDEEQQEDQEEAVGASGSPDDGGDVTPAHQSRRPRAPAPHPPPRELLVALRDAWEGCGREDQTSSVVFGYRADVQEFLNEALPQ